MRNSRRIRLNRSALRRLVGLLGVGWLIAGVGCAENKTSTQPSTGATAKPPVVTKVASNVPASEEELVATEGPGRIHTVQPGETLYSITNKYYGDGKYWRKILLANRNRLQGDPRNLKTGMKLIIP